MSASRRISALVCALAAGCIDPAPPTVDGGAVRDAASHDATSPDGEMPAPADGGPLGDGGGSDHDGGSTDGGPEDGGAGGGYVRPTGTAERCDTDGFCWVEPRLGGGDPVRDVYRVGDDALWAIGYDGMIAYHEAGELTFLERIVDHRLNAIDGRAPDDLWIVGDVGTATHFDGTAWTRVPTGVTADLYGVWVADDGTAYAVGESATVLHYRAGEWVPVTLGVTFDSPPTFSAVSGWDTGDVWVVGSDNTILHLDGGTWSRTDPGMAICDRRTAYSLHWFSGVVAVAPGHALMVGRSYGGSTPRGVRGSHRAGVFACSADEAWPVNTLTRIDGTSVTDAWATGGSTIDHWDGFEWQAIDVDLPDEDATMGVHAYAPGRVLLGGTATILDYAGGTVTPYGSDTRGLPVRTGTLSFVEQVSVAPDGTVYVLHRSGLLWRRLVSGALETVQEAGAPREDAIAAVDARRVWLTDGGDALLFDGATPTRIAVSTDPLRTIVVVPAASSAIEAYATDYEGRVWHIDATGATAVSSSPELDMLAVAADGTLYAGDDGWIYRREGDAWVSYDAFCRLLYDLDVNGAHLWAVGECAHHFDGTTWSEVDVGTSTYRNVEALPDGRAIAVRIGGQLIQFDGTAWSDIDGESTPSWSGALAADATHVYLGTSTRGVMRRAYGP